MTSPGKSPNCSRIASKLVLSSHAIMMIRSRSGRLRVMNRFCIVKSQKEVIHQNNGRHLIVFGKEKNCRLLLLVSHVLVLCGLPCRNLIKVSGYISFGVLGAWGSWNTTISSRGVSDGGTKISRGESPFPKQQRQIWVLLQRGVWKQVIPYSFQLTFVMRHCCLFRKVFLCTQWVVLSLQILWIHLPSIAGSFCSRCHLLRLLWIENTLL